MKTITERLFLDLSGRVGIRVTKDNFRSKLKTLQTNGAFGNKIKSEMLVELFGVVAELDEEIQSLKK